MPGLSSICPLTDSERGFARVAGDHLDLDAAVTQGANRFAHAGPGRVQQAHEAQVRQLLQVGARRKRDHWR